MVKYFNGQKALVGDLGWGDDTDSDCEDDSAGVRGRSLKGEQGEWKNRAVLTVGSFPACVCFLDSPLC